MSAEGKQEHFGLSESGVGISEFLGSGPGFKAALKQSEEDFVVTEIDPEGNLLKFSEEFLYDVDSLRMLLHLPFITEESIEEVVDAMKGVKIERREPREVGRLVDMPNKDLRRRVHQLYALHPHVYTASEGDTIVVYLAPSHKKNIYTVNVLKKNKDTAEVASTMARILKTVQRNIQFSGTKDRKGIALQKMSIKGCSFAGVCSLYRYFRKREAGEIRGAPGEAAQEAQASAGEGGEKKEYSFTMKIRGVEPDRLGSACERAGARSASDEEKIQNMEEIVQMVLGAIEKGAAERRAAEEEETQASMSKVKGVMISHVTRVEKSLQLGEIGGNRFQIILRDVDVEGREKQIAEALDSLRGGFLNYYGAQRFGRNFFNPMVGEALIADDYDRAVSLIMENTKHSISEKALRAMEHHEAGRFREAAEAMPQRFASERSICLGKDRGHSNEEIVSRFRRETRMLYIHSYQSMIFNRDLSERIRRGPRLMAGDYVLADDGLSRPASSVTSPSYIQLHVRQIGEDLPADAADLDSLLLKLIPKDEGEGSASRNMPRGGFRKAIVRPQNLTYELLGRDRAVRLAFDLPPGTYATMAIREATRGMCSETN